MKHPNIFCIHRKCFFFALISGSPNERPFGIQPLKVPRMQAVFRSQVASRYSYPRSSRADRSRGKNFCTSYPQVILTPLPKLPSFSLLSLSLFSFIRFSFPLLAKMRANLLKVISSWDFRFFFSNFPLLLLIPVFHDDQCHRAGCQIRRLLIRLKFRRILTSAQFLVFSCFC